MEIFVFTSCVRHILQIVFRWHVAEKHFQLSQQGDAALAGKFGYTSFFGAYFAGFEQ